MLFLAVFIQVVNWLEQHQLSCLIKTVTGHNCPGCGFQRSFIDLLHGNLVGSLQHHAALIPLLLACIGIPIQVLGKFEVGAKILVSAIIFVLAISLISYTFAHILFQ